MLFNSLVKQHYIVTSASDTRVINSNEKVEERMRELERLRAKEEQPEGEEDGFLAGIEAEKIEVVPEVSPEEIIEEAKAEAKQILEEARKKADDMLNEAHQKSAQIYEEQKNAGYEAGTSQSQQELEECRQQLRAEAEQESNALRADYEKRSEEMESDIIDALIQVFNHVFHIQFDDKKEILLHLVKNTLMHVEIGKAFRIRVAETNHHFLETHLDDIRERIGNDISIEIVNDMNLDALDCRIETDYGVFDCGIDMELSKLEKDIRSLCS